MAAKIPVVLDSATPELEELQSGDTIAISLFTNDSGYLTSETSHADVVVDGDFTSNGILKRTAAGTYGIVTDNSANWDTAFGWGDHASGGYLVAASIDTLAELNAIVLDATLIDTADSRLSDARTPTAHNQAWSTITSTPTTLAGYGITDAATSAQGALAEAFTGTIHVETVADQDYELSFDIPFAGTITTLRTKTQSGTCTVTGKINTTALGGTANSASSTAEEQAHASANTFVKGDTLKITVSANSSAADLEVAFLGTRS